VKLFQKYRSTPSLDDIAFESRNKDYGAYYLRRKYTRYLSIAALISFLVLLLAVFIPFFIYYFEEVKLFTEPLNMEVVEVYPLSPPQEDENALARSAAKPPEEKILQPVVQDSVPEPEKEKPEEITKPVEETKDTTGKNSGGTSDKGTGSGDNSTLYTILDVYPHYPGGDQARFYFLRTHISYPEDARKKGIQGVVIIVFVIEEDGSVSNIKVTKSIGGGCDEEAVRVIRSMPLWEPGKRSGRPVRVLVRMPIVFRIPGK
jgi:protein TonB